MADAVRIDLDVDGDVQLSRQLVGISRRGTDLRPAWHQIADDLMGWERRQFDTEGAFGSGGWAPLSPWTVMQKQMLGQDNGILHRSGALMRSLTTKGASGNVTSVSPHQLVFGTTIPYARYHQSGTARMPMRKPIELPEQARRSAVKTLQRFWVTGVAR